MVSFSDSSFYAFVFTLVLTAEREICGLNQHKGLGVSLYLVYLNLPFPVGKRGSGILRVRGWESQQ